MEFRNKEIKTSNKLPRKTVGKKRVKPKKGSPEAIFKAIDELNKAGFTLSDIQL
jgi:hypothetical protein